MSVGNVIHVYHAVSEGYGRAGLSRLSAAMGTQEMSSFTFTKHANFINDKMDKFYNEHESLAHKCIENVYELEGKGRDSDGILNVDVSFDGTWLTRGHKSHIGASFVMDISTGLVIDSEVLSNFCRLCVVTKKKKSNEDFENWHRSVRWKVPLEL